MDKVKLPCITLWQPWASLIGAKPIENRNWPPPRHLLGRRVGIHAGQWIDPVFLVGKRLSLDCINPIMRREIEAAFPGEFEDADLPRGHIVSTARLIGYIVRHSGAVHQVGVSYGRDAKAKAKEIEQADRIWSSGSRFGWAFDKVVKYDNPIQARGAQGIWYFDDFCFCEECGKYGPYGDTFTTGSDGLAYCMDCFIR